MIIPAHRILPKEIRRLKNSEVLVFETDNDGNHDLPQGIKAISYGVSYGAINKLSGRGYGIPTYSTHRFHRLHPMIVKKHIKRFISFAKKHPHITFLLSPFGTSRKTYDRRYFAYLFKEAIKLNNIILPKGYANIYNKEIIL
jgi:hypothetical protein